MAYIQQQTSNEQATGAMSGAYETIQINDSDDDRKHMISLANNDTGRNESQDSIEQQHQHQHQHHHHQPQQTQQHHQQQQHHHQQPQQQHNRQQGPVTRHGAQQHLSDCNGAGNDTNNLRASSVASSEERQNATNDNNSNHDRSVVIHEPSAEGVAAAAGMKTPNSYKYPLLSKYYQFGPWIGRNRKAICLGCRLQTSSSQPDRLLKHLNKCSALTEEDKVAVQDLMNERTANKRKKPMQLRARRSGGVGGSGGGDDSEYYDDDDQNTTLGDDLPIPGLNASHNAASNSGTKKQKTHSDRKSQIDEALARFIMMCRIPLKAIHSPEFVEFIHALDPNYHIPSRETITNVLIPGLLNII